MRVAITLVCAALAIAGSADAKAATLSYMDYANQDPGRNRLSSYTNEANHDKIENLPGMWENSELQMFSGYLEANPGRYIHYWFIESQRDPANDPLLLWTNGGPGCSGMLGLLTEQGPFKVARNMTLVKNRFAWTNVANMVFIEAPVGVGFSYAVDGKEDTGDWQTAEENYNAIQSFYKKFPQFQKNKFYLTSESYGGHYLPTLSKVIVDNNIKGEQPHINFVGFAVGNPYTDPIENAYGRYGAFWGKGLLSRAMYDPWEKECKGTFHDPADTESKCAKLEKTMNEAIGNLNQYALNWPVCPNYTRPDPDAPIVPWRQRVKMLEHLGADEGFYPGGFPDSDRYDPCEEHFAHRYLNSKDVQEALNVRVQNEEMGWMECRGKDFPYRKSDQNNFMQPIYKYLIDHGVKILVYSGDDDAVCGIIGTQAWIWDLGYEVDPSMNWQPWNYKGQTNGFLTKFQVPQGFSFLTVHGAGHEVPAYRPEYALRLITSFLNGEI